MFMELTDKRISVALLSFHRGHLDTFIDSSLKPMLWCSFFLPRVETVYTAVAFREDISPCLLTWGVRKLVLRCLLLSLIFRKDSVHCHGFFPEDIWTCLLTCTLNRWCGAHFVVRRDRVYTAAIWQIAVVGVGVCT